ncbi:MAG: hypothetical protein L6Q38_19265 [Nitrospira sp.]|nr:hypothetical protein [Nitrospira sp.]
MNPVAPDQGLPWWRRRWIQGAAFIAIAQAVTIWLLSPRDVPVSPQAPRSRQVFQDSLSGTGDWETFKRLLTPSLMPSWKDFSGSAWLARVAAEVTFEPLSVENRPLPPVVLALMPMEWPSRDDRLHELAWQWTMPPFQPGIPKPAPLPLPTRGSVRVVEGLEGWAVSAGVTVPPPPPGPAPRTMTLRIVLDAQGRVAVPPVIWIESGVPEADAIALRWAANLRFVPEGPPGTAAPAGVDEWRSGLLVIDWAVAPSAEPKPEQGVKS